MPPPSANRSRTAWIGCADNLVANAQRYMSPNGAFVHIPGTPSRHGRLSDGTEGFARLLLLHAMRLSGDPGAPARHTDRFLEGLDNGLRTGRAVPTWIDVEDRGHALPEASSIALSLALAPEALWAPLPSDTKSRIVDWLTHAARAEPFENNWVMFGFVIEAFFQTVDAPIGSDARERALEMLERWQQPDGWISDGTPGGFDYYASFALHYYPLVVSHIVDDPDLRAARRPHTARFLESLAALIGDDGAPTYFGRSLTYRWAVTSTVSAAALTDCLPCSPREAHALTSDVVDYFMRNGALAADGTVRRGWHGGNRRVAEPYSGPAASYWLAKPFVDLLLPADSEYWAGPAAVRPRSERVTVAPNAGFLVHRGHEVRLVNHGSTDRSGAVVAPGLGSVNYGALEYSPATAPVTHIEGHSGGPTLHTSDGSSRRAVTTTIGSGARWAASSSAFRGSGAHDIPAEIVSIAVGDWLVHAMRLADRNTTVPVVAWSGLALGDTLDPPVILDEPRVAAAVTDGTRWSVVVGLAGWDEASVISAGPTAFAAANRVPLVKGAASADGWWIAATYLGSELSLDAPRALVVSETLIEFKCTHGAPFHLRTDPTISVAEPAECCV